VGDLGHDVMPDSSSIWAATLAVLIAILTLPVGVHAQACVGRAGLEPGKFELKVRGDAKAGAGGVALRTSRFLADAEIGASRQGPGSGWSFVEANVNSDPVIVQIRPGRSKFIGASAGWIAFQRRVVACVMGRGVYDQTSHYFEDRSTYAFNRFVSFSRESISDSSHGLWKTVGMLAVGAEFNKLNPYGGFAGARTSSSFGQVSCSPPSSTCRTEVADLTEWYWWIGLSYRFSDRLRGAAQGGEGESNLWIGWIL
jgi:hypothetical protein